MRRVDTGKENIIIDRTKRHEIWYKIILSYYYLLQITYSR